MSEHWYLTKMPDEIVPVPWLHPDAVAYFEGILEPEWCVLEQGSGGSTLWLAERVKQVVSIEHDIDWMMIVHELAPANVTLLGSIPDESSFVYDLIYIDGEHEERKEMLERAGTFLRNGGWVVLDNANRPEYETERSSLSQWAALVEMFENNNVYSQFFVTEFWKCV